MEVRITNKWESDLAVIYSIRNTENEELDPILLFYSKNKDPYFRFGDVMELEKLQKTGYYKSRLFETWDDIPNDMAMSLSWY